MVGISDSSPAVDCTSPHTLETYLRGTAPAEITHLGPERPGPEILTAWSAAACPADAIRPYLGATELDMSCRPPRRAARPAAPPAPPRRSRANSRGRRSNYWNLP